MWAVGCLLTELVTGSILSKRIGGHDFGLRTNPPSILLRSAVLVEVSSFCERCHAVSALILNALTRKTRVSALILNALTSKTRVSAYETL